MLIKSIKYVIFAAIVRNFLYIHVNYFRKANVLKYHRINQSRK